MGDSYRVDYDWLEQHGWPAAETKSLVRRLLREFEHATEILGDDKVLQYVTSGNSVPVTRCTVSADLIRRLVQDKQALERKYRYTLFRFHPHLGKYGDDGEMQCSHPWCWIDFKRDPLPELERKLGEFDLRWVAEIMEKERSTND